MRILLTAAERAGIEATITPYDEFCALEKLLPTLPDSDPDDDGRVAFGCGSFLRALLAHAEVEES